MIAEDDVSTHSLVGLFERAFLTCRIDDDGDIYVTSGLEFPIWVSVDEERKLLQLATFAGRREDEPLFTEADANRLNTTIVLPNFCIDRADRSRLHARCFVPFEGGLVEAQLIAVLRRFASAFLCGARSLPEIVLH